MALVDVKYNPFTVETIMTVDGDKISEGTPLYELTSGKRLQEWIDRFSRKLVEVYGSKKFSFTYCGLKADYNDFEQILESDEKNGVLSVSSIRFNESAKGDEAVSVIRKKLSEVFHDLQNGPIGNISVGDFLNKAFYKFSNSLFDTTVVAPMSSGKSTVLNSLLGKKLLPALNTACTATMTEIVDNKNYSSFCAECFDKSGSLVKECSNLTYDLMEKLNSDKSIDTIRIAGNVNFIDSDCVTLKIIDTPGPNSADNPEHRDITYQILNDSTRLGVILYVLNADQLGITDDKALLENISKIMSESASKKSLRDKFLFVVNKMDKFDPGKQNIQEELGKVRNYLNKFGIDDPQIFPCSSLLAMCLRDEYSQKIDINRIFDLNRNEKSVLSKDGKDALTIADLLYECEQMHLERYASLPLGLKNKIEERLHKAINDGNIKEQLLIYSGIPSLEAAIENYVVRYGSIKIVGDFAAACRNVLVSEKLLSNLKSSLISDKKEAERLRNKLKEVRKRLAGGESAKEIKQKIDRLDPMPDIIESMDNSKEKTNAELSSFVQDLSPEEEMSPKDAKVFISNYRAYAKNSVSSLRAVFYDIIKTKLIDVYDRLMEEYKKKLNVLDSELGNDLDGGISLSSLIIDSSFSDTNNQSLNFNLLASGDNASLDDVIDNFTEERVSYKTELRKDGMKEIKIKIGEEYVQDGYKDNPDYREGSLLGIIDWNNSWFQDKRIPRMVWKDKFASTFVDNIVEHKTEIREKFVDTKKIVDVLLNETQDNLDSYFIEVTDAASEWVVDLKNKKLKPTVDKAEAAIEAQYADLERYVADIEDKKSAIAENERNIAWIEDKVTKIDDVLNIYSPFC